VKNTTISTHRSRRNNAETKGGNIWIQRSRRNNVETKDGNVNYNCLNTKVQTSKGTNTLHKPSNETTTKSGTRNRDRQQQSPEPVTGIVQPKIRNIKEYRTRNNKNPIHVTRKVQSQRCKVHKIPDIGITHKQVPKQKYRTNSSIPKHMVHQRYRTKTSQLSQCNSKKGARTSKKGARTS
jgi:hypothetical protein